MPANPVKKSPCESCGACCAFFRVSIPDNETDEFPGGRVPAEMTLFSNETHRCMKGTEARKPRCIALKGRVGFHVKCSIYDTRPSACREFRLSWDDNVGNRLCDKAREVFGLQAFSKY